MKRIKVITAFMLIMSIVFSSIFITKDIPTAQAASVSISDKALTLELGRYKTLKVYGTKSKASWKSSNSWVATVSSTGKVTAKAAGSATITGTVAGKKLTCKVTVLRIKDKAVTLTPGKKSTIAISGPYKTVTWSSSDKSVATVSSKGVVTAKQTGATTITAIVDGKELTSKVTVVDIDNKSIVLELGGWSGYVKTLHLLNVSGKVTWTSSNNGIATVSNNGKVTARGAGSATITATVNGTKLTTNVKVLRMSLNEFTLDMNKTKTLKIYGTSSKITWHSNDLTVAKVSSNGTVTPIAPGTATITGYVDGRKVRSELTVVD
jgi:chitinase